MNNRIDHFTFWPPIIIMTVLVIPLVLNPEAGIDVINGIIGLFTQKFGWLFMAFGLMAFVFLMWLAFGRYGNVKLGTAEDVPEFSKLSYIAMLFTAGVGTGLIYWSIIEPIYYMQQPPYGIKPGTAEAAEWGAAYGAYHWGFIAWSIYCLPAVPLAYAYHVRKRPNLRLSSVFYGKTGKYANNWFGKLVDLFVMLGLLGASGTMLGLGTPMVTAAIAGYINIKPSFLLNFTVILIWTVIIGASVYKGLNKGIRILSNINIYIALFLALFVLAVGPTAFNLNTFTNSAGLIFQNFVHMSLWTDPIKQSGWPQSWTIFFWAWWIASTPFFGLFIARISKGRTIREVIMNNIVWGTLGCWVYFAIFGSNSIYVELYGETSMTQMIQDKGPEQTIFAILESLPLSAILIPLFIILMFIFLATTADSGAYILASITTKNLKTGEEPKLWNRLFWAALTAFTSLTLISLGGLEPLQASSTLGAFPLLFVLIACVICFIKDIGEDLGSHLKKEIIVVPKCEPINNSDSAVKPNNHSING